MKMSLSRYVPGAQIFPGKFNFGVGIWRNVRRVGRELEGGKSVWSSGS